MNTRVLTKFAKTAIKNGVKFIKRNKSSIMVGLGLCGFYSAIEEAVRVTPKAQKKLEDRKKELKVDKLPTKEVIKTAGPCYIHVAAIAATSTGCVIGGVSNVMRKNAALATACTLSQDAFDEYKKATIETVGEKKEQLIEEAAAKNVSKKVQTSTSPVVVSGNGTTTWIETYTKRSFLSSYHQVEQAIINVNKALYEDGYVTLNDLYYELGLSENELGSTVGWQVDKGLVKVRYDSELDEEMNPCVTLTLLTPPYPTFA